MNMKQIINKGTLISRNPEQLFSTIDEEVVMLSVPNGEYYNLNSMGSYIWKKLEIPMTLGDLITNLCEEFEVEEQLCLQETKAFIEGLKEKNIVQLGNG